ncbi:MAG: NADH-quinone oxidoreductase subunit K [Mobilicoccus sp.]|nr:NADH-quinone oxidoreductase subunit K [Mobilicoccus sp.]
MSATVASATTLFGENLDVTTWTLWLAAVLTALGLGRLLTTEDPIARLVALNVTGAGTLLVLVGLSTRTDTPDAIPQALALTGIVITVAVTGVALVLAVRSAQDDTEDETDDDPDADAEADEPEQGARTEEDAP